jgi:glycerophosphoryl diester phosphodiesterase
MLADSLKGESLIWYNTLWDTMAGGHDDDMSLASPDEGYGYLIDVLGCRIIQTDRPEELIEYLKKKGRRNL